MNELKAIIKTKDECTCLHMSLLLSDIRDLFSKMHFESIIDGKNNSHYWAKQDTILNEIDRKIHSIKDKVIYGEDISLAEELIKARQEIRDKYTINKMETELCQN